MNNAVPTADLSESSGRRDYSRGDTSRLRLPKRVGGVDSVFVCRAAGRVALWLSDARESLLRFEGVNQGA